MTWAKFWDRVLDRMPGWPSERQAVTFGMFLLTLVMLQMATDNPALWDVKLFEVAFQAIILTGLLNMILAFHFAANKSDEARADLDKARAETTHSAFQAITATANAGTGDPTKQAINAADEVVEAAADKRDEIKGDV